jgi:hypothetical protein
MRIKMVINTIFAVTEPGSAPLKSIEVILGIRVIGMSIRIAVIMR